MNSKYYGAVVTIFFLSTASCLGMLTEKNRQRAKEIEQLGTDINQQDTNGDTPLYRAVARNDKSMVRLLLEKEADPRIKNNDGFTPLHRAVINGDEGIVSMLLEAGSDIINQQDNIGYTALARGVASGNRNIVKSLLEAGVNSTPKDQYGDTPLHWAVMNGDTDMVTMLLHAGADQNSRNKAGNTPIDLAQIKGFTEILDLIQASKKEGLEPATIPFSIRAPVSGGVEFLVGGRKPPPILAKIIRESMPRGNGLRNPEGAPQRKPFGWVHKNIKIAGVAALGTLVGLYYWLKKNEQPAGLVQELQQLLKNNRFDRAYQLAQDNEAEFAQLSGDERTKLLAAINRALGALTQAHEAAAKALPGVRQYQQWALGSEADHVKSLMNLVRIINS
jgi:Ankyrin repeats (3 copies)